MESIPAKVGIAKAAAVANPIPLAGSIFFGLGTLGCLGFFCKGPDIGIVGPLGMKLGFLFPKGFIPGPLNCLDPTTVPLADLRLSTSTPPNLFSGTEILVSGARIGIVDPVEILVGPICLGCLG